MIMLKLLVIADDLTGANEVAVQFAKKNIATLVVLDWREEWIVGSDEFQVVAVNTDSRHVSVNEAQQRMRTVLKAATSWQNPFIYKKIDSTLRGNVAAELDMMRTCLGEEKSMLIPANPSMGRTVEQGVIFVQGEPLAGSAYAGDPLEPTQESSVVRKLQCQIDAPYHLITRDILKKFHTHKQNIFQEIGCYVFDSATEQDLRRIGRLLFRENLTKVLAGSGGFAALLTEFIEFKNDSIHTLQKSKRRLLINGSLNPVVHEQIQWARSHAIPVFTLEHQRFDREERIMMDNQYLLSNWLFGAYQKSQITVLTTPSREKLNNASTSFHDKASKWNNYLGMLIASLLQVIQIEVLVIFGGDTALAILKALQLKRMVAVSEIIPGVALLKPLNGMTNPIYIVTRPGGFGEENHIGLIENFFKNGSNETSRNHDGRRQRGGS